MGALIAAAPGAADSDSQNLDTSTSDASTVTVYSYTIPTNSAARVVVEWIASDATGTNAFTGELSALARAPGGISVLDSPTTGDGVTRMSSGWLAGNPASRPSITFYVSGLDNKVLVFCKGRAATFITWRFTFRTNEG